MFEFYNCLNTNNTNASLNGDVDDSIWKLPSQEECQPQLIVAEM